MTERVVLLHGLARSPSSLSRMERHLRSAGFSTLRPGHASRHHSLAALTDTLHEDILRWGVAADGPLHFVGHSLGGLLARAYVHRHRPGHLGRTVQLGSPNGGSEVADLLGGLRLYRRMFGPVGVQLGTRTVTELAELLGTSTTRSG